jgi:AcrR family transcriptional regulator
MPARSPFLPGVPLAAQMQDSARERIVLATAETVTREGYRATTVAQIVKLAGLDRRAFYKQFADKPQAFIAVQELAFRRAMAVTAGAFFSVDAWPERVWEAGRTLTQFIEQNPALAHACLIDGHAAGPLAAARLEELTLAFTLFLQEGYGREPPLNQPAELALEGVAAICFEIAYRSARGSGEPAIARLVGHLAYLCLAPFLGAERAGATVEERLKG